MDRLSNWLQKCDDAIIRGVEQLETVFNQKVFSVSNIYSNAENAWKQDKPERDSMFKTINCFSAIIATLTAITFISQKITLSQLLIGLYGSAEMYMVSSAGKNFYNKRAAIPFYFERGGLKRDDLEKMRQFLEASQEARSMFIWKNCLTGKIFTKISEALN